MRYLEGDEVKEADKYMQEASLEAKKSPCRKSKRGVVIVKDGEIIGRGFNAPPGDLDCIEDICYSICAQYAVHAEMAAMHDALKKGYNLRRARIYHIEVKGSTLISAIEPTCIECSKHIFAWNIEEVVLKLYKGYALFNTKEFHELSLDSLEKKMEK